MMRIFGLDGIIIEMAILAQNQTIIKTTTN